MPSIIQYGLFFEGLSTAISGVFIFFRPDAAYNHLVGPGTVTQSLPQPPSSVLLLQFAATMFFSMGLTLLLVTPNTKDAAARRRVACTVVLIPELLFVPWLLWKAASDRTLAFDNGRIAQFAASVVPFLLFRSYALFIKPAMLEPSRRKSS